MDPDEPDGITSPPEASAPGDTNVAPPGAVTKSRLQNLEQNLLVLERTYGATHPQVFSFCSIYVQASHILTACKDVVYHM